MQEEERCSSTNRLAVTRATSIRGARTIAAFASTASAAKVIDFTSSVGSIDTIKVSFNPGIMG